MSLLLALLLGCGDDAPCEGKRDLSTSPAGLALTQAEHPAGWGQSECFQCHQAWEIHAEDCIDGVALVPEDIADAVVDDCVACHGANGVAAWQDTGDRP